ncbi:filamentous hemagglutinin N-terminal domain-containing protein [Thiotrichales bacterium HSG1]|nr:filamentous hemagglutinin N-terminal domain-containing protein [Thiotrichales bacterium HSG1]
MKYLLTIPLLFSALSSNSEVITDGTLGQNINLSGPDFQITSDLGQQHGGNLFHSFQDFNLNSAESATFSGPNSIQNILSRVTGGNPSNIDGLIRSTIPNANVYFLNPYGIMFGSNARLDVQGSFHASTADYLKLGENGRFDVRNPNNSLLTVAPVEAFGFINSSAPITISGYGKTDSEVDNLSSNHDLSFIGGEITIKNGTFTATFDRRGRESATRLPLISAPNINLIGVNSNGEVSDFDTKSFSKLANISIQENSLLQGNVTIRGEKFLLDNSSIEVNDLTGDTDIQAKNVLLDNANLKFTNKTAAKGSDIKIQATESINITDSNINSKNYSSGNGGDVILNANQEVDLTDTALMINSESQQIDAGKSGVLTITAKDIIISGNSINMGVLGKGDGGNITFTADKSINLIDNVHIYVDAYLGSGDGGEINFTSKDVKLLDGAFIDGRTKNVGGNAGNININASGNVTISGASQEGKGRPSAIMSGSFMSGALQLSNGVQGGDGGNITIKADNLLLKDGGMINSNSSAVHTNRSGDTGKITIQVNKETKLSGVNPYGETEYDFGSGIYAKTIGIGDNNGQSGQIDLQTGNLIIEQGAVIKTDTNSATKGGDINIVARDNILITGDASNIVLKKPGRNQVLYLSGFAPEEYNVSNSGIYSRSNGDVSDSGNSGSINITAKSLTVKNNGTISTSSKGNGQAGNITISAEQLQLAKGAISSESLFNNVTSADMLDKGDIVIIEDVNGKKGHYINVGNGLIRFNPIYKVANLDELNKLSEKYILVNGDIVEVDNKSYIYSIVYGFLENWTEFDENAPNTITLNTKEEVHNADGWYPPDNPPPYNSGQVIKLQDKATFIYDISIDPFTPGYVFGNPRQVNYFKISNLTELEQMKDKLTLQNGSLASLPENGQLTNFFYYDQEWIKFNNTHLVADVGKKNKLVKAQVGHVKDNMIYTGKDWIPVNNVNGTNLETTANNGDLISIDDESFFYVDGEWKQQIRGGDAGQINITVTDKINLTNSSSITTEAKSSGGGGIHIQAGNLVQVANSKVTTSVKEGFGDGGNLTIENPEFIVLNQGKIIAQANKGQGGNIRIIADQFITSPDSLLSASSNLGLDGEVSVESLDVDLTGALKVFGINFLNAAAHMRRHCTIEDILNKSTFYVFPMTGSQPFPADLIANKLILIEDEEEVNLKVEVKEAKRVDWTRCRPDLLAGNI